MRLFLNTRAMCMRTFFTFKSITKSSTCKWVPVAFSFVDICPFTSARTPSNTASKSPAPLAGMMSSTPELEQRALIVNRGMAIRASNGLFPSLNLTQMQKKTSHESYLHLFCVSYTCANDRYLLNCFHREIASTENFHIL